MAADDPGRAVLALHRPDRRRVRDDVEIQLATRSQARRVRPDVQHDLRAETYDRIQRLKLSSLGDGLDQLLQLVVAVGGVGLIPFAIDPQLAPVTLAVLPFLAVVTVADVRSIEPRYEQICESVADPYSRLENSLTGIQ